jgi:ParB-like chromosome segregation protein Spo0J
MTACGKITTTPDVIEFHPLAALFALVDGEEFSRLVEDIRQHGLREPVTLYENKVLDGRNRYRACVMAEVACRFEDYTGDDPAAFVLSMNLHRRHLSPAKRRELIAKVLKAKPDQSNRQIGTTIKADHKTVGTVRSNLEARGEIPHVETRADTKGRKQPAKKKRRTEGDFAKDIAAKKAKTEPVATAATSEPSAGVKGRRSRSAQWMAAVAAASDALGELLDLQEAYVEWRDGLPENLQGSAVTEKLDAVCDLDIQSALSVIEEAEGIDLPLGFGRD